MNVAMTTHWFESLLSQGILYTKVMPTSLQELPPGRWRPRNVGRRSFVQAFTTAQSHQNHFSFHVKKVSAYSTSGSEHLQAQSNFQIPRPLRQTRRHQTVSPNTRFTPATCLIWPRHSGSAKRCGPAWRHEWPSPTAGRRSRYTCIAYRESPSNGQERTSLAVNLGLKTWYRLHSSIDCWKSAIRSSCENHCFDPEKVPKQNLKIIDLPNPIVNLPARSSFLRFSEIEQKIYINSHPLQKHGSWVTSLELPKAVKVALSRAHFQENNKPYPQTAIKKRQKILQMLFV